MIRNVKSLTEKEFDLVIIGGGIFGICAAWDAVLRGFSVALVERGDFAHATSANCFKMVHGGIRYLQHGDLYRIRESSNERRALLRIAPHLVHPLPIAIPTYGKGLKGKALLQAAFWLYEGITADRNRGISDPKQHIPAAYFISREECIERFPGVKQKGLTGAAIFYDGQMRDPARLALSFLKSACEAGVRAANYVEAIDFLQKDRRFYGVKVQDRLGGETFDVRGRLVINAAGPWANRFLFHSVKLELNPSPSFSRDTSFVVNRRLINDCGLAVSCRTQDPDALLSRGARHLFLVPWRNVTLVGVWHVVYEGHPDQLTIGYEELRCFLDEINEAYPTAELTEEDISQFYTGLVLFGANTPQSINLSYGKRSMLVDHKKQNGLDGLITLVGVRYTTARGVAERAIDLASKKLNKKVGRSYTSETPIDGGDFESFENLLSRAKQELSLDLPENILIALLHRHGTRYKDVLHYVEELKDLAVTLGQSDVIKAEVVYCIQEEMAMKLEDVIFRRTGLGTATHPGEEVLTECSKVMASALGWDETRRHQEIEGVNAYFRKPVIKRSKDQKNI